MRKNFNNPVLSQFWEMIEDANIFSFFFFLNNFITSWVNFLIIIPVNSWLVQHDSPFILASNRASSSASLLIASSETFGAPSKAMISILILSRLPWKRKWKKLGQINIAIDTLWPSGGIDIGLQWLREWLVGTVSWFIRMKKMKQGSVVWSPHTKQSGKLTLARSPMRVHF